MKFTFNDFLLVNRNLKLVILLIWSTVLLFSVATHTLNGDALVTAFVMSTLIEVCIIAETVRTAKLFSEQVLHAPFQLIGSVAQFIETLNQDVQFSATLKKNHDAIKFVNICILFCLIGLFIMWIVGVDIK